MWPSRPWNPLTGDPPLPHPRYRLREHASALEVVPRCRGGRAYAYTLRLLAAFAVSDQPTVSAEGRVIVQGSELDGRIRGRNQDVQDASIGGPVGGAVRRGGMQLRRQWRNTSGLRSIAE